MRDLLHYIVTNIVSKPDEVKIEEENNQGNVDLFLTVDPSDMGLIIGKGGQTIRAIRKLLTVRAIVENVRVNLQLVETNPPLGKEGSEPETETDSSHPEEPSDEGSQDSKS